MEKIHDKSNHHMDEDTHEQYQRILHFILDSVSRRFKILIFFAVIAVVATIISHVLYLPTYEARSVARVQLEQKVSVPILLANQAGGAEIMSDTHEMARHVRFLGSEAFLQIIAQDLLQLPDFSSLDLTDPKSVKYTSKSYWDRYFADENTTQHGAPILRDVRAVADKLPALVRVDVDNVELLNFTVNTLDEKTSYVIANLYAEEFAKLSQQKDSQEIVEVEKFIRQKLETVSAQLKASARRMVLLKEKNHMFAGEGAANAGVTSQLGEIDRKLSELWIQEAENESTLKRYQDLAAQPSIDANDRAVYQFRIDEIQKKRADIEAQKSRFKKLSGEAEQKFSQLPKAEQEYLTLKRQESIDYELYSSLVQKLNQLEIQKYSIQKKVNVELLARHAYRAARVNFFLKIIYAFMVSSFFAIALILGLEWLNPTIKSADDFRSTRIENIGIVPKLESIDGIVGGVEEDVPAEQESQKLSKMLVTRNLPKSVESMAFKYIRARLQKTHSKVILLTSSTCGDGKSFTASNLAVSFAQLGKRTLLIDTDFRHPSINRFFEIPNKRGLASVLHNEKTLEEVIVQDEVVSTLSLLPAEAGIDHPTELLSDERFLEVLEEAKSKFDFILIDTAPIQLAVDALVLSSAVNSVVVVSRYRKTLKRLISKTYRDIVNVHFQKVYGILNGVEQSRLLKYFDQNGPQYGAQYGSYYSNGDSPRYFTRNQQKLVEKKKKKLKRVI